MILALGIVWLGAFVLSGLVFQRSGKEGLLIVGRDAVNLFKPLVIRFPCALLAAAFLVQIIPVETISNLIGRDSGMWGMVVAAAAGGFLPGGPVVAFPLAAVFHQAGAGVPQLVALISGWSIFAINRLLTYEAPIMGWRFAALRNLSSLALPVLAGFGTEILLNVLGAH